MKVDKGYENGGVPLFKITVLVVWEEGVGAKRSQFGQQ